MKRADSINCPVPGCNAKIGDPCGIDDNDAPTAGALNLRKENATGTTGIKAPFWHVRRGDLANGESGAR